MDKILIELQAKLNEAKSKGTINQDINKLQKQIDNLKLQAEINPKAIPHLIKQIDTALHSKINISNVNIDESSVIKSAQQTGEKIGTTIKQSIENTNTKTISPNIVNQTANTLNHLNDNIKLDEPQFSSDSTPRNTSKTELPAKDRLKQIWDKLNSWSLIKNGLGIVTNQIKKIPNEVYEIDSAMHKLQKVTSDTEYSYNKFLDSANNSAQELGMTVSHLIEQTTNWAKLGYSIEDSAQLVATSSIYANVGEVDDKKAVSDLATAMKAFNIEAENSLGIVDSLNALGNSFATDSASLGDGLAKSASALSEAGNDIHKTLAMLTGGTEITQNASEMGNSLKVLSMRIRGMKGKLEELGEEYENVESISKIQTQILNQTDGAVNIFDDKGNFRATYDILQDIAEVWDKISQTDQAALLETIGGKQRGNQVAALIQSFQSGQAQKAYETSVHSSGSAMQEQEKWLESLEAKTQQFEAAFQSLANTVLDSGLLKDIVDFGTTGLNAIEGLAEGINYLNSVFGLLDSSMGGTLGMISGLIMNKAGIGERTRF